MLQGSRHLLLHSATTTARQRSPSTAVERLLNVRLLQRIAGTASPRHTRAAEEGTRPARAPPAARRPRGLPMVTDLPWVRGLVLASRRPRTRAFPVHSLPAAEGTFFSAKLIQPQAEAAVSLRGGPSCTLGVAGSAAHVEVTF